VAATGDVWSFDTDVPVQFVRKEFTNTWPWTEFFSIALSHSLCPLLFIIIIIALINQREGLFTFRM